MDIYGTWKVYKTRIESEITKFNESVKEANFDAMKDHKEKAKSAYLKFIELLKL